MTIIALQTLFIRGLVPIALYILASGFVYAEERSKDTGLNDLLDNFITTEFDNGSSQGSAIQLITSHYQTIIMDPELAIKAIIIARQYDDQSLALSISGDALRYAKGHAAPRLIYEVAFTLLINHDCQRARRLFIILSHDDFPANDWIKSQSRQGLLLCPEQPRWDYDYSIEIGHDDNLGGATPQAIIPTEPGSALDQMIQSIEESSPINIDIPNQVVLGENTESGFYLTYLPQIKRRWRYQNLITLLRLNAAMRLTHPSGYESLEISGDMSRHHFFDRTVFINQIHLHKTISQRGSGKGDHIDMGVSLFSGIETRSQYPLLFGVLGGNSQMTSEASKINTRSYGYRIGIRSNPVEVRNNPNPIWGLSYQFITKDADQTLNDEDEKSLALSLSFPRHTAINNTSLEIYGKETRPHYPRPWLRSVHTKQDRGIAMTLRHHIFSQRVSLTIHHLHVKSADPLEKGGKTNILVRLDR